MRLEEYVSKRIADAGASRVTRMAIFRELQAKSGVSLSTIRAVDNGMRLQHFGRADAIARATEGAVSVDDLCRAPN